jgi:D-xylose transport system ATP-binding protein
MTATPVLCAENIFKRFGGTVALDGVSFDLAAGEIHALCGENGAGKSTLIKVMTGLYPAGTYEGSLRVDGAEARLRSVRDAEQAGIAVIPQELALVEDMTVAENIFLGAEPLRGPWIDWDRMVREAARLLERFAVDLDVHALVRTLGVGRKQLVAIVKALRMRSRVLVLDEPTAALAEHEVAVLLDILRDLRRRGIACVYISHRLDEVLSVADRVTVLRDGHGVVTLDTRAGDVTARAIIRHMVGREIKDLFPRQAAEPGRTLLRVEGLQADAGDGGALALTQVSFDVRAGEVLGVGGLAGSGRTELLMHLFAAWGHRRGGSVHVDGRLLRARTPRDAIAAGMVLVSEDRKRYGLFLEQSLRFNVSLSVIGRFAKSGFIDDALETREVSAAVDSLHIKARDVAVPVRDLSGGNQQKVVLAKGLLALPKVVLLDEPTRGIDVGAKLEVYALINELTAAGKAVVLVSSELPELLGMSDRILVLRAGAVSGMFSGRSATPENVLAAAVGHA